MLLWTGVSLVALGGVAMLKIWSWMEINRNLVTREIKRVELQIARPSERLNRDGP